MDESCERAIRDHRGCSAEFSAGDLVRPRGGNIGRLRFRHVSVHAFNSRIKGGGLRALRTGPGQSIALRYVACRMIVIAAIVSALSVGVSPIKRASRYLGHLCSA
jgi:hypothetical protein